MDDFEIPARIWANAAVLAVAIATVWTMLFNWSARYDQVIRSARKQGRARSRVGLKT
jgi:hypothetical protein